MSDNQGSPITLENGVLSVPDRPTVHYIEGDGIGIDITPVMINVIDAAVEKAYGGQRSIAWSEVLAGEKAFNATGEWLPEATLEAMRSGLVSMKQPLRHLPTYVVHHVDLREMSRRLRPALGIKFQPRFGEGPIFQTRDDVSYGACTDGLEHDLHRGRAVVPIHVQPIFGAIEARHFAAPGPMDFGLHAVA